MEKQGKPIIQNNQDENDTTKRQLALKKEMSNIHIKKKGVEKQEKVL